MRIPAPICAAFHHGSFRDYGTYCPAGGKSIITCNVWTFPWEYTDKDKSRRMTLFLPGGGPHDNPGAGSLRESGPQHNK